MVPKILPGCRGVLVVLCRGGRVTCSSCCPEDSHSLLGDDSKHCLQSAPVDEVAYDGRVEDSLVLPLHPGGSVTPDGGDELVRRRVEEARRVSDRFAAREK